MGSVLDLISLLLARLEKELQYAFKFQVSSFKLACLKSSSFKLARLEKELQYDFKFALICHLLKNQVSFLEECEYNNAEKLIC